MASRCKCTNPCTCYFEFNGDRPNTIYKVPYEYGRYSTRRTGTGTAADPYIIEFLDSEEFKVEAGQAHSTGTQTITSTTGTDGSLAVHIDRIDYETPNEIFLAFNLKESSATAHEFLPSAHRFWYVSAQATFVNNGAGAPGHRRLAVYYNGATGDYGLGPNGAASGSTIIAGSSTTGVPGTEDVSLSCSGLAPFMNGANPTILDGPGGRIQIELMQSSGTAMTIRDIYLNFVAL